MESRSYRFISDPDHKENLSGRVRAACLTCRRKKIKCDGEVPCQTCKEKGVLCEGLTERKRPTKPNDRQRSVDASSFPLQLDAAQSARKKLASDTSHPRAFPGQPDDPSKRPQVIRVDTVSSDSSGSSGQHSRPNEWAESIAPHQTGMHAPPTTYDNLSSFHDIGNITWNIGPDSTMGSYTGADMMSDSEQNYRNQLTEESPAEWRDRVDSTSSWASQDSYRTQEASELLSAAKLLEAHAQSLRWLASEQQAQNLNDARRQPASLPRQSDVYSDFSNNNTSVTSSDAPKDAAFDDVAMAIDRLSNTGNNAGYTDRRMCECGTWIAGRCSHWKHHGRPAPT